MIRETAALRRGQVLCSVLKPRLVSICFANRRHLVDSSCRFCARRTRFETLSVPWSPNDGPSSVSVAPVHRRHSQAAMSRPAARLRNAEYSPGSTWWAFAVAKRISSTLTDRSRRLADSGRWSFFPSASTSMRRKKSSLPNTHSRKCCLNGSCGTPTSSRT